MKPPPTERARLRALASILALLAAGLGATLPAAAYVVPSDRVLAQWVGARGRVPGPVLLPVAWGERHGVLYAGGPGGHALALDGEPPRHDPGPGVSSPLAPLWRALDLFATASAADLSDVLEAAGVDLGRSGYARSSRSDDGVAFTLGARGETEPTAPQVHFARAPLRALTVRLPGHSELHVGEPGPGGWPTWFALGDEGTLRVLGPPRASTSPPPWAVWPGAPPGADGSVPADRTDIRKGIPLWPPRP
ncbi:MAG: hypothetical protein SCH98_12465 [Deferrisomatales bacterium]|nr:hypothetical protein [Deferrisomatales bacterium]